MLYFIYFFMKKIFTFFAVFMSLQVLSQSGFNVLLEIQNATPCNSIIGNIKAIPQGVSCTQFSYLWSSTTTTASVSISQPGTYTVTVTNLCDGSTATNSAQILGSAILGLGANTTSPTCVCNGAIDLIVLGQPSQLTYNWGAGLPNTEDAINLCAGIYTVTVTDQVGCTATLTVPITQSSCLHISAQITNPLCSNSSDGKISLSTSGGLAPYTYNWLHTPGNSDPSSFANLYGGSYYVIVTDNNGCTQSQSFTITNPAPINITAFAAPSSAMNTTGFIDATVTGGIAPYTYTWSNGATTQDINNLSPGIYSITVTDGSACTATKSFTVTSAPTSCFVYITKSGSSSVLVANYQVPNPTIIPTFSWSQNGTPLPNGTSSILASSPGNYCVTITGGACSTSTCYYVTGPPLTVGIQAITSGCTGNCTTTLTATSPSATPPFSFLWSWGASTTATITSQCSGQTVTVTVTDATGTTGTQSYTLPNANSASINLKINSSNPAYCNVSGSSAAGTATCEKVCPNTTVTYNIDPPQSCVNLPSTYNWSVAGALSYIISPNSKEITVNWGDAGAGLVEVSAFTGSNLFCGSLCVDISPKPAAKFATNPTSTNNQLQVCKGQKVWFQNQSLDAEQYEWQFSDDLSNLNTQDVQHTFNLPGNFTVLLIARTECLCADTTSVQVEVLDAVSPLLDCVNTLCPGEQVTYTADSQCGNYNWTISPNGTITGGGGSTDNSITVLWNTGPAGIISLNATACSGSTCPATAIAQVPILSDLAEIVGAAKVCPNSEEKYSITRFEGSNYVWKILGNSINGTIIDGQGRDQITVQWGGGTVTTGVTVEYDNCYLGCKGRDTLLVTIRRPFNIEGALDKCDAGTGLYKAVLTGTTAPNMSAWTLFQPNGAPVGSIPNGTFANITFNNGPGTYRLRAIPTAGGIANTCSDSADWKIAVKANPPKPTGITGPILFCPGSPNTYTATGTSNLYNVKWEIKNSNGAVVNDEGQNVVTTFTSGSPRWVAIRQISTDGLNCLSDSTRLIVNELPPFSITGNPDICQNNSATYKAPNYANISYTWSISPANVGVIKQGQNTPDVEIYWNSPGVHTVTASACGKTATFIVNVWAPTLPDPIYPPGLCPGSTGTLDANGFFNAYQWKNAGGTTISTDLSVNVGAGNYALVVTDIHGCKGTTEFVVEKYAKPNVQISTIDDISFCNTPVLVDFVALVDADGDFTYKWLKDNVLVSTDKAYTATDFGKYRLVVTNQYGCTDADGDVDVIADCGPKPNCVCGASTCPNLSINIAPTAQCDSFNFASIYSSPIIAGTEKWRIRQQGFPTLGYFTTPNVRFKFPNAGKYIVELSMQLPDGTLCYRLDSIDVLAKAQFIQELACPSFLTKFIDESTFLPGAEDAATWHWDFNDFAAANIDTSSLRNPSWAFAGSNIYNVQLTITAGTGCTSTAVVAVNIPDPPVFNILPQTLTCAGTSIPAIAVITNDITEVKWFFGDPGSGALNNSQGTSSFHQFATAGTYTVVATATNISGCTSTRSISVNITPNTLSGSIAPSQSVICEGKTLLLTAPSGGAGATYLWAGGLTTNTLVANAEKTYTVTVSTPNGCTYSTSKTIQVNPAPDGEITAQIYNDNNQLVGIVEDQLEVCKGEDVFLQVRDNGTYSYQWSGGLGIGDNQVFSEERGNLLPVGTYNYGVTITNATTGCTAITPQFTVEVNPVPEGFSATANQFCAGTPSIVSYAGPQPPTWQLFWNNGEIGPSFTTNDPGRFFVKVINQYQCSAESNKVIIHPGPNIAAIPGGCHTRCTPDTLCINPMPEITSWQWFFEGNPIAGATTPDLVAQQSGTYYVAVTDNNGCNAESAPLNLTLFTGYGDITTQVWSDVNNNGTIDAADTLINGIPLHLWKNDTLQQNGTTLNGKAVFADIQAINYTVTVDSSEVSLFWDIIIGAQDAALVGCDSKAAAGLLLRKKACAIPVSVINTSLCLGSSYDYYGISIPAGSSQVFTTQNAQLCDSTVQVNVGILPTASSNRTEKVCPTGSFSFQGTAIPVGTSQTFSLVHPVTGCDSMVTIQVVALPTASSNRTEKVCPTGSYSFLGTAIPVGTSQTFSLIHPVTGCDSMVTIQVVALPTASSNRTEKVCPTGSFSFQGTAIPVGTSQTFSLVHPVTGCDSMVTIQVVALPTASSNRTEKVCPTGSYSFQGTAIPVGTSQIFSLIHPVTGCDSMVTIQVEALPTASSNRTEKVCPTGSYAFQGTAIPVGTSQTFSLVHPVTGCDSMVTIQVVAYDIPSISLTVSACEGTGYMYNGSTVMAGTTKAFTLTNLSTGCDSIVNLSVTPLPLQTTDISVNICPDELYNYNGQALAAGQTYEYHFKTQQGECDSTVFVTVTAWPSATFDLLAKPSCAGTPTGAIEMTNLSGGTEPFTFSLENSNTSWQNELKFNDLAPGTFKILAKDSNDCIFADSILVTSLQPLSLALPQTALIPCDTPFVLLQPNWTGDPTGLEWLWNTGATTPKITVSDVGIFTLQAKNSCETVVRSTTVNWADLPVDQSIVYLPNVVAPEDENAVNAIFAPMFMPGIQVLSYKMEVFDRWGNLVSRSTDSGNGWDTREAVRKQNMAATAVYIWWLTAEVEWCGRQIKVQRKGDITVVR
jgi:hydrogenase/urease accessory protein HupE/PKD repeat protein